MPSWNSGLPTSPTAETAAWRFWEEGAGLALAHPASSWPHQKPAQSQGGHQGGGTRRGRSRCPRASWRTAPAWWAGRTAHSTVPASRTGPGAWRLRGPAARRPGSGGRQARLKLHHLPPACSCPGDVAGDLPRPSHREWGSASPLSPRGSLDSPTDSTGPLSSLSRGEAVLPRPAPSSGQPRAAHADLVRKAKALRELAHLAQGGQVLVQAADGLLDVLPVSGLGCPWWG